MSINFDIASDYKNMKLLSIAPELSHLDDQYCSDGFACIFDTKENTFYSVSYLWQKRGDYTHIKKERAKLKYTDE